MIETHLMAHHYYLRLTMLSLLILTLAHVSCKTGADDQTDRQSQRNSVQADSIFKLESQRVLKVLIAKYIKPEYFSLRAKSSPYHYERNSIQDSLRHIDSAFCNKVLMKMEFQHKNADPYIWTEEILPKAIIVHFNLSKTDPLCFDKIRAMAGEGLYFFSEPLFNDRYDLALIDYGFSCGDRCGRGKLLLYRKVNGQWEEYKILSDWIA